jgi:hypothetical protein
MRTRKSAPTLTVQQRRREIIDLLAGHLARMPEAVAVSAPCDRETDAGCDAVSPGNGLRPEVSKSHVFAVPPPWPWQRCHGFGLCLAIFGVEWGLTHEPAA